MHLENMTTDNELPKEVFEDSSPLRRALRAHLTRHTGLTTPRSDSEYFELSPIAEGTIYKDTTNGIIK